MGKSFLTMNGSVLLAHRPDVVRSRSSLLPEEVETWVLPATRAGDSFLSGTTPAPHVSSSPMIQSSCSNKSGPESYFWSLLLLLFSPTSSCIYYYDDGERYIRIFIDWKAEEDSPSFIRTFLFDMLDKKGLARNSVPECSTLYLGFRNLSNLKNTTVIYQTGYISLVFGSLGERITQTNHGVDVGHC